MVGAEPGTFTYTSDDVYPERGEPGQYIMTGDGDSWREEGTVHVMMDNGIVPLHLRLGRGNGHSNYFLNSKNDTPSGIEDDEGFVDGTDLGGWQMTFCPCPVEWDTVKGNTWAAVSHVEGCVNEKRF